MQYTENSFVSDHDKISIIIYCTYLRPPTPNKHTYVYKSRFNQNNDSVAMMTDLLYNYNVASITSLLVSYCIVLKINLTFNFKSKNPSNSMVSILNTPAYGDKSFTERVSTYTKKRDIYDGVSTDRNGIKIFVHFRCTRTGK